MTQAGDFRAVYRRAGLYDHVLLPHYFDGVDDAALVGQLMAHHYGPGEPRLRILDLGCGSGRVTAALAPYARRLTGVDNSPAMIEAFRARYPDAAARCLDIEQAAARLLAGGRGHGFDVVGAFWSLNYALGECFEEMTPDGIRPGTDATPARARAGRLVRNLLQLLAPHGHLVVSFFDSDTREQRLVTRLWERVAPFPGGGRHFTRHVLLDELREAENRGQGRVTHTRRSGVAIAPDRESARKWFTAVHLKNFPALVNDPTVRSEVSEFVAACTRPSGEVLLPSGVHVIDFQASPDPEDHLPSSGE